MSSTTFRSKVDAWLALVIVGAFASVGVVLASVSAPEVSLVPVAAFAGVGAAAIWWLHRSTTYTLSESQLCVRSTGLSWCVPLRDIRAVTPTRDPLASPALSLDRLRIDYGPLKSIMVSPANRELFLKELERRRASV
jgi:hypothetical protein